MNNKGGEWVAILSRVDKKGLREVREWSMWLSVGREFFVEGVTSWRALAGMESKPKEGQEAGMAWWVEYGEDEGYEVREMMRWEYTAF